MLDLNKDPDDYSDGSEGTNEDAMSNQPITTSTLDVKVEGNVNKKKDHIFTLVDLTVDEDVKLQSLTEATPIFSTPNISNTTHYTVLGNYEQWNSTISSQADCDRKRKKRQDQKERKRRKQLTIPPNSKKKHSVQTVLMTESELMDCEGKLDNVEHILFLDLDNWRNFFMQLDFDFPASVYLWVFYGGGTIPVVPKDSFLKPLLQNNRIKFTKLGRQKNAADFAICLHAGRLDQTLPPRVSFTLFSGDKSFESLKEQLQLNKRRMTILDPHHTRAPMATLNRLVNNTLKPPVEVNLAASQEHSHGKAEGNTAENREDGQSHIGV